MGQKPLLIQYNNVCWTGGTFGAALDLACALPEFEHRIMIKHDSINYMQQANAERMGVEVAHLPILTKEFLDINQPYVLIANNPGGNSFERVNPTNQFYDGFKWLLDYPVLTYHHSAVHPWIPTRSHIFCSEYLRLKYRNLWGKMDGMEIVPPCINTENFSFQGLVSMVPRDKNKLHFGIVMDKEGKKYPRPFVEDIINVLKEYRENIHIHIIGGDFDYDFVTNHKPQPDLIHFFSLLDVFIHTPRIPDTWGRVLTEAMASGCYVLISGEGGMYEQTRGNPCGYKLGEKPIDLLKVWAGQYIETMGRRDIRHFLNRGLSYMHARKIGSYQTLRETLIPILFRVHTGSQHVISV